MLGFGGFEFHYCLIVSSLRSVKILLRDDSVVEHLDRRQVVLPARTLELEAELKAAEGSAEKKKSLHTGS